MNLDLNTLIIIGIIVFSALLVDGILLGIIFSTLRGVAKASNWSSTMGTVIYSAIESRTSGDSTANYPVVHYTYQVMGQTLQGRKIMPGPEAGGVGSKKIVARYPVDAQVMVYYDPNNPSDAVLERSTPGHVKWLWITIVLVDIFLCALGIVLVMNI